MVQIGGLLDAIDRKLESIPDTVERNAKREEFIEMGNCAIRHAIENDIGYGEAPNWTTDAEDLKIFEECVTEDVQNEFASFMQSQTNGTK